MFHCVRIESFMLNGFLDLNHIVVGLSQICHTDNSSDIIDTLSSYAMACGDYPSVSDD